VSFIADPGDTIAIVGPTGSGKSTLIALLARLYDPTRGTVLFDEIPLTELDPSEVKEKIGMVPQDIFLFSDTIARNISLGSDHDLPKTVHDGTGDITYATKMAQLHEQITEFPNGYETLLGERGINLSGGQKQRATLARALARDPLILVLDDALSAVDTHTEMRILDDLQETMSGRTSFIISHRVSAVMRADKILVLDEGVVVESGTHAELIATGGTYTGLLRRQLLEEDLEAVVVSMASA
jgi:ATP-binding cassette subfamily B protein